MNLIHQTLTVLILTTSSRVLFGTDRITGCSTPLFQNPSKFFLLRINFQPACTSFQTCLSSKTPNKQCVQDFEKAQLAFCSTYTPFNLFRRRYCKRLVTLNMIITNKVELPEKAEEGEESEEKPQEIPKLGFKGYILSVDDFCLEKNFKNVVSDCMISDLVSFLVYKNGKYAVLNSDGGCLQSDGKLKGCDFADENIQMDVVVMDVESSTIINKFGINLGIVGQNVGFMMGNFFIKISKEDV